VFGPTVKRFLEDNFHPLKCLLILDNAPAHPPGLENDILDEFSFIKVLYLPPNTTSILQPMDQQIISNFKKLYTKHLFKRCFDITENTQLTLREFWKQHFDIVVCLKLIDVAWQEVSTRTLISGWRKLWPDAVSERGFEGFDVEEGDPSKGNELHPVVNEIISLGNAMGLEVNEEDINELVEEYNEELSTEDLKELEAMQQTAMQEELTEDDVEGEAVIVPSEQIKEVLKKFHEISAFIEKNHPEKVYTSRAIAHFDDVCLSHFRQTIKNRPRQTSLDRFFTKRFKGNDESA